MVGNKGEKKSQTFYFNKIFFLNNLFATPIKVEIHIESPINQFLSLSLKKKKKKIFWKSFSLTNYQFVKILVTSFFFFFFIIKKQSILTLFGGLRNANRHLTAWTGRWMNSLLHMKKAKIECKKRGGRKYMYTEYHIHRKNIYT